MSDLVLIKFQAIQRLLSEASTIKEAKIVSDLAAAAETYSKRIDAGREIIRQATELKLRAERLMGEILTKTPKNEGGNPALTSARGEPVATLGQLGISKKVSSRAQKLASVPKEKFEAAIEMQKASGEPLSIAALGRTIRVGKVDAKEPKVVPALGRTIMYSGPKPIPPAVQEIDSKDEEQADPARKSLELILGQIEIGLKPLDSPARVFVLENIVEALGRQREELFGGLGPSGREAVEERYVPRKTCEKIIGIWNKCAANARRRMTDSEIQAVRDAIRHIHTLQIVSLEEAAVILTDKTREHRNAILAWRHVPGKSGRDKGCDAKTFFNERKFDLATYPSPEHDLSTDEPTVVDAERSEVRS